MDPVVGSLAGSALGALSGIFTSKASLQAQREENEKNRQHNLKLAQLQNEWNQALYDKNNEYNKPVNEISRLREAGINTDLFYGGIGSRSPAVAPEMTSGMGSSGSVSPLQNPVDSAAITNSLAQARYYDSLSKKNDSETENNSVLNDILSNDAKWRDAINSGKVDLQGVQIKVGNANSDYTREKIREIEPTINQINALTEQARSTVDNLDSQTILNDIEAQFRAPKLLSEIRNISASSELSEFEVKRGLTLLTQEYLNLQADTSYKSQAAKTSSAEADLKRQLSFTESDKRSLYRKLGINYDASTQQIVFNLSQDKKFQSWERSVNIAQGCARAFKDVLQGLVSAGNVVPVPARKVGF